MAPLRLNLTLTTEPADWSLTPGKERLEPTGAVWCALSHTESTQKKKKMRFVNRRQTDKPADSRTRNKKKVNLREF